MRLTAGGMQGEDFEDFPTLHLPFLKESELEIEVLLLFYS